MIKSIHDIDSVIKLVDVIGYLTPKILFILSCFLLWSKPFLLIYYFVGFFINMLLNVVLKITFKQPRPSEDIRLFNIAINNGKRMKYDVYGMPSGHAQTSFYSLMFIYLVFKNNYLTLFYFILSLLTLYQRVKYKNHTFNQVIVGSIVGSIVGYFIFYISTKKISGKLKSKKDDNALN
jgi:membrane-associated phospholipid phosphatase